MNNKDEFQEVLNEFQRQMAEIQASKIGVACSGGVDSVTLLYLAVKAGLKPTVLHVNYGLRGEESDADEAFVRSVSQSSECECRVMHVSMNRRNIQEKARELRYDWFLQQGLDLILLAHHADDVAETLLFNISRGSGLLGMASIPPRQGIFFRPLIRLSKAAIRQYAISQELPWREDSSNLETSYSRNLIRNKVLPLLEEVNPKALSHISMAAFRIQDSLPLIDLAIDSIKKQCLHGNVIDLSTIRDAPYFEAALYHLLVLIEPLSHAEQFNRLLAVIDLPGREVEWGNRTINIGRNKLHLGSPVSIAAKFEMRIELGDIDLPGYGMLQVEEASKTSVDGAFQILLDNEWLGRKVIIRPWQLGDRMQPFGMRGSKLLSDIFVDLKLDYAEKHSFPVMEWEGVIIWLIGLKASEQGRSINRKNIILNFDKSLA